MLSLVVTTVCLGIVLQDVAVVESLRCQACVGAKRGASCPAKQCSAAEVCFVEETVTALQEVLYNRGCETQQVCEMLSSSVGRRYAESRDLRQVPAVTTCFRCCDTEQCNSLNCTVLDECNSLPCGLGATCENTAKGFLCHCAPGFTGTRCTEDVDECLSNPCHNGGTCVNGRGLFTCNCPFKFAGPLCDQKVNRTVCQTCTGVSSPLDCNHALVCGPGEECYTDKVLMGGNISYNMGCRTTSFCSFFKQHVQVGRETRQSHAITTCSDCCSHDDCNRDVCREEPTGTVCMSCDEVKNPDDCHNVTVCDVKQECYGQENLHLLTGEKTYGFGCAAKQVCGAIAKRTVGSRDVSTKVTRCLQCCDKHYCNKQLCAGAGSTTTAPPVGVMCFNCTMVDSPLVCTNYIHCPPGEECSTRKIQRAGYTYYDFSCCSPQTCPPGATTGAVGKRRDSETLCFESCNKDKCNRDLCP